MQSGKTKAFTLIELLVVLAILALVLAMVPPMLNNMMPHNQVKSATRYLAAGLKATRMKAVTSQSETVLMLDVNSRNYSVGDTERKLNLPDDAVVTMMTAESELTSDGSGGIRFFADGSSTGGRIALEYRHTEFLIDVNWLTGKVSISP